MRVVIVNGVYGYRPQGGGVRPAKPGMELDLSQDEAERLEALGVARIIQGDQIFPVEPDLPDGSALLDSSSVASDDDGADADDVDEDTEDAGNLAYSADMTVQQLVAVMDAYGLKKKSGMTKADMVAALDEYMTQDAPPMLSGEPLVV